MKKTIYTLLITLALVMSCSQKEKKYIPFSSTSGDAAVPAVTTNVTGAILTQITVSPADQSIAKDTHATFKATGIYSDGTLKDISNECSWTVKKETDKATADSSMKGRFLGVTATTTGSPVTVNASYGSRSGDANLNITSATIASTEIASVPSINSGGTNQYTATGVFSDGTTQDISSLVTWSSNNTASVAIDATTGVGTAGSSAGTATITATLISPTTFPSAENSGTATTNTAATGASVISITVTGVATVDSGTTSSYSASAIYSDGTSSDITNLATWSLSSYANAAINDSVGSKGIITTISPGVLTVRATYAGFTGTKEITIAQLTVSSVLVVPSSKSIAKGTSTQFTATASYSNGTTMDVTNSAVWSSSNTSVAGVTTSSTMGGSAQGISTGSATISATIDSKSAYASLTVSAATLVSIAINANATIEKGITKQFTATGTYSDGSTQDITSLVSWNSSSPANVTISNATDTKGLATGVTSGSSTIQASLNGINSNTSTLAISAATLTSIAIGSNDTVENGTNKQYTATGTFSDGTTQNITSLVTWFSSSIIVATISNADSDKGMAYSLDIGSSSISATLANGTNGITTTSGGTVTSNASVLSVTTPSSILNDTMPPYFAIVSDITASDATVSTLLVKFSESVQSGGGVNAGDLAANYTVSGATVASVTKVSSTTYKVILTSLLSNGTEYTITADTGASDPIKDLAGNNLTSPNVLTFIANDEMRIVQAEAVSTSQIKVYYSRLVANSGNGTGACASEATCAVKYYITPSLGTISSISVSDNIATMTISGSTMKGIAYTLIAANGAADNPSSAPPAFDSGTAAVTDFSGSKTLTGNPKDRISFTGKGTAVNEFADGWYMSDPYGDGSVFSFTFKFKSKVYVGPNLYNNTTLRFDTDGSNVIPNTYAFNTISGANCSSTPGFGYGFDGSNISSCDRDGNGATIAKYSGPFYEEGLVGYTSVTLQNQEVLMVGPIQNNIYRAYFTQDTDNKLDMKAARIDNYNAGSNIKSIQTLYAYNNSLYVGFASSHGTFAPALERYSTSVSGSTVSITGGGVNSDLSVEKALGKAGSINAGDAIGIDSIVISNNFLYVGSSSGLGATRDLIGGFTKSGSNANYAKIDLTAAPFSGQSLVLPGALTTNSQDYPQGLLKVSPGQRGVPYIKIHNSKLYMARNVASGTDTTDVLITRSNKLPDYAEVWVCATPTGTVDTSATDKYCKGSDWSIVFTTQSSVSGATRFDSAKSDNIAISMFEISPTGMVYLGFDSPSGFRVYRNVVGTSTDISNSGWTQEGPLLGKDGFGDSTYNKIQSSAIAQDKDNIYYTYITVGGYNTTNLWHKPIQVYRQADDGTARIAFGGIADSNLMAYLSKTAKSDVARGIAFVIALLAGAILARRFWFKQNGK